MNQVTNYFSYLPKRALIVALTLASVFALSTAVMAGFGPDRPTKAWQGNGTAGFNHITFNSFTGVPDGIGDEREFFRGKIVGEAGGTTDPIKGVEDGDELYLTIWVHNGADPSMGPAGEARNLRVKVDLPDGSSTNQVVKSTIMASNAQPVSIVDSLNVKGGDQFELEYVPGSATIVTHKLNYVKLSDDIVSGGTDIGYDALNGRMPGCFEFAGWVNLRVKVKETVKEEPETKTVKDVRKAGSDKWQDSISVDSKAALEYRIVATNTGNTTLKNFKVKDVLPEQISGKLNSISVTGANASDVDKFFDTGLILDKLGPGKSVTITFKALIDVQELECGKTHLVNTGKTWATNADSKDTAGADVVRKCDEPQKPVFKCTGVEITKLDGRKVRVDVNAFAKPSDLVKISGYSYDFGDGDKLNSTEKTVSHTYAKDGNYTTNVVVFFDLNGADKGELKTRQCNNSVSFDTPVKPPKTPPKTPPELPNTGPGSIFAAIFGTSTLGAAVRNWFRSRVALRKSLLGDA